MQKTTFCAALLSCLSAAAPIIEFLEDTIPSELIDKREFAVINFYDNSDTSKEINQVFELAHEKFTELEDTGQVIGRDVGWFRLNIELYPHLKMEDVDKPNQVITGHRLKRNLNFLSMEAELEQEALQMAGIVFDMTGNWVEQIACEDIMGEQRHT